MAINTVSANIDNARAKSGSPPPPQYFHVIRNQLNHSGKILFNRLK